MLEEELLQQIKILNCEKEAQRRYIDELQQTIWNQQTIIVKANELIQKNEELVDQMQDVIDIYQKKERYGNY